MNSEMPRCATCRWWDSTDGDVGTCDRVAVDPTGKLSPWASFKVPRAGDLLTVADFGCVKHEPRERDDGR